MYFYSAYNVRFSIVQFPAQGAMVKIIKAGQQLEEFPITMQT